MIDPSENTTNSNCNPSEIKPKALIVAADTDYYLDNGFMVFTEAYHLKRGYCCKNNCRHCPYGFRKKS